MVWGPDWLWRLWRSSEDARGPSPRTLSPGKFPEMSIPVGDPFGPNLMTLRINSIFFCSVFESFQDLLPAVFLPSDLPGSHLRVGG